jgi:hypothetical protein
MNASQDHFSPLLLEFMCEAIYAIRGESGSSDSDKVESFIQWNVLPVLVDNLQLMSVTDSSQDPQRKRRKLNVLQVSVLPAMDKPSGFEKQNFQACILE